MTSIRRVHRSPLSYALLAFAACGGQPVAARTPAPHDDGLAHPYLYQVSEARGVEQATQEKDPPTIEVSGQGSVTVTPDLARATFAVESHAKTATEAADANATAMASVLKALRAAQISGLKVESFGYSLQPQYTYPTQDGQSTREVAGYIALNNVRATVPDVSVVGKAIDVAVRAGANRVASLTFEASDTEAARRDALTQAVQSAQAEAETIAAALGRQLGPALEVHGGAQTYGPQPMMQMALRRSAAADTPIEAADQTVTASVTIRFAIGSPRE